MTALDMKTKEQLLIEKIRLLENLVYNLTYRGERKERLNLRKQLTSLTDQINEVKKKKQQPMEYLKECIEKATPNLSKIKDVDKELAEIRGEQPEITDEMISTYFSNHSNCFAKNPIKMPAMTRSAVIDTVKWALSLKAQKPSDEDIEKWVENAEITEVPENSHLRDIYIRQGMERGAKAMRDGKIPVSGLKPIPDTECIADDDK